ncbi:MAG: ester cyclase [Chloroflexi bacterium]|nr:ester cyclase [Chloroflexota bacterium]
MSIHNRNKEFIGRLRAALYDIDARNLQRQLRELFAADCKARLAHPLESLHGVDALYERAYLPLLNAAPDLERRDFIVMAGATRGQNWVGCAGHYVGVFEQSWLDIPPTKHLMAMRYHEFFRIEDERIVELQALWDIPQVMMAAGAWPLAPSLAVEWIVPGPATTDGIITSDYDEAGSAVSVRLVGDMLSALGNSPQGEAAMALDRYWHPKMMWYGPAGIGSMRRISGFRHWHQIPFLKAMPDRAALMDKGIFFGDAAYVGFTAFPGMTMTISGDGWLGIAPSKQAITMRSLDFWRCEKGMIRENWVLVDLLDVYHQLGVDVFERMRELTAARRPDFAI